MTMKEIAKKIIASINPGNADISGIGDGTIKGALVELNSKFVYNSYQTPTFELLNCTGSISHNARVAFSDNGNGRSIRFGGRIIINNFVRTDGNPGIILVLPFYAKYIPSLCVGNVVERENEIVMVSAESAVHNNGLLIRSTETYTDAKNGTMTFIIPLTTIDMPA